mgnify:FL=1
MEMKWTPEQQKVIELRDRNILVSAAAGSGKTAVLVERILGKLTRKDHPIDIDQLLIVTFTRAAAGEMRERVDKLVGYGSESIWVSTFHSMCVRILRRHIDLLGYDTNFTIYDSDDQKTLMREVCKLLQVDTKMFRERALLSEISKAKDELVTPQEYRMRAEGDYSRKKIAEVYEEYEKQNNKK